MLRLFLFSSLMLFFYSCSNDDKEIERIKELERNKLYELIQNIHYNQISYLEDEMDRHYYLRERYILNLKAMNLMYSSFENTRKELKNNNAIYKDYSTEKWRKLFKQKNSEYFRAIENSVDTSWSGFISFRDIHWKVRLKDSMEFDSLIELTNKSGISKDLSHHLTICHFYSSFGNLQNVYFDIIPRRHEGLRYDRVAPLAAVNKGVVIKGGMVEVTAGVGSFEDKTSPKFSINNKQVSINADGVAMMKVKAPNKKGKFIIPVEITFTNPNGEIKRVLKIIDIQVVDSICN